MLERFACSSFAALDCDCYRFGGPPFLPVLVHIWPREEEFWTVGLDVRQWMMSRYEKCGIVSA